MDTSAELVRSPDFWFEDGTVVLQVETTLFRVYRGLLASRSTVFCDTFSIPQPPESERNEIEGCPVVELHDKAKDFVRFLKALHNYGYCKTCPVSNFVELSSILRLSDKYDVPALRDPMISVLRDLYPDSFSKWEERTTPTGYSEYYFDQVYALNLAVKLNLPPILPLVMYQVCCRVAFDSIVDGKGRLRIENKEFRKKCILGYPQLQLIRRTTLLHYLTHLGGEGECATTRACDAERLRWIGIELADEEMDPLADENEGLWENFSVCPSCLEAAKQCYRATRQKLWDDLPGIFDLGTWEDLLPAPASP